MLKLYRPGLPPTYAACYEPTTLTLITTAALVASTAVATISSANAASAAADQANLEAEAETDRARKDAEDHRRRQSRVLAAQRARRGASGIQGGTGTPLLFAEDTAAEIELGALNILSGGQARSTALRNEANIRGAEASNIRTAGFLKAGTTVLDGAAQFGRLKNPRVRTITLAGRGEPGFRAQEGRV